MIIFFSPKVWSKSSLEILLKVAKRPTEKNVSYELTRDPKIQNSEQLCVKEPKRLKETDTNYN
jgi:hypothetical protein